MRTVAPAEHSKSVRPIRNRQRVSSQDLYQSMSVLRVHSLEKDFFQSDWHDVDRPWMERARFLENRIDAGARKDGEHAAVARDPFNTACTKCHLGRVVIEYEVNAPELLAQVVER